MYGREEIRGKLDQDERGKMTEAEEGRDDCEKETTKRGGRVYLEK